MKIIIVTNLDLCKTIWYVDVFVQIWNISSSKYIWSKNMLSAQAQDRIMLNVNIYCCQRNQIDSFGVPYWIKWRVSCMRAFLLYRNVIHPAQKCRWSALQTWWNQLNTSNGLTTVLYLQWKSLYQERRYLYWNGFQHPFNGCVVDAQWDVFSWVNAMVE